jgi:hypothetical protein
MAGDDKNMQPTFHDKAQEACDKGHSFIKEHNILYTYTPLALGRLEVAEDCKLADLTAPPKTTSPQKSDSQVKSK